MVNPALLVDLQNIDIKMVYEVVCLEHNKRYKLEIFADNYEKFMSELSNFMTQYPKVSVLQIVPRTPKDYSAYMSWK